MIGLPAVSSASAWNSTRPRLLAHEPVFKPSTTALGQRAMRVDAVCTSPFGSLKVSSVTSSLGRVTGGNSFKVTVAAPLRSVLRGSLSATSLPCSPRGSSSSSRLVSRGGPKLNSS